MITYRQYKDESDLATVAHLIDCELSEPYTVYTYRYFLHHWPKLCYIAYDDGKPFGTVVCKMDVHVRSDRFNIMMNATKSIRRGGKRG